MLEIALERSHKPNNHCSLFPGTSEPFLKTLGGFEVVEGWSCVCGVAVSEEEIGRVYRGIGQRPTEKLHAKSVNAAHFYFLVQIVLGQS